MGHRDRELETLPSPARSARQKLLPGRASEKATLANMQKKY